MFTLDRSGSGNRTRVFRRVLTQTKQETGALRVGRGGQEPIVPALVFFLSVSKDCVERQYAISGLLQSMSK